LVLHHGAHRSFILDVYISRPHLLHYLWFLASASHCHASAQYTWRTFFNDRDRVLEPATWIPALTEGALLVCFGGFHWHIPVFAHKI
jgi:hypothetical protein